MLDQLARGGISLALLILYVEPRDFVQTGLLCAPFGVTQALKTGPASLGTEEGGGRAFTVSPSSVVLK